MKVSACCLLLFTLLSGPAAAARPHALLVFDPEQPLSVLDANGIRAALDEQQTPYVEQSLPLSAEQLRAFPALLLAHVELAPNERAAVQAWVHQGGGLIATGRSGFGLEPLFGIGPLQVLNRLRDPPRPLDEIRFVTAHPASTGHFWSGPISQIPPMPAAEMPAIQQLYYADYDWPAYAAAPGSASVLARWRSSAQAWGSADAEAAVFASAPGAGRAIYFGALPGSYNDPAWGFPLSWRTAIGEALAWVNSRGTLVQLGHWPDAHRGGFAFSADTERASMVETVPALLAIIERLGLGRFGTFFIVGQAGGDPGTVGAQEHPEVVAQIEAAGAELGGHGDIHTRFAGQSLQQQIARLQTMRGLIESRMSEGAVLRGFRGPGLAVDRTSWSALAAVGLAYDSSDQDVWSERGLPWRSGEVWQLPPTAPMDYTLLVDHGLSTSEWLQITRDKLAYSQSRRGLFNWLTHPWLMQGRMAEVEQLLREARDRGDLWMRRLDDILDWWVRREALRIVVLDSDPFRLQLRVENTGARAVEGASVWLRPAAAEFPWRARVDGQEIARIARPHGLGSPQTAFEVVVIPRIEAQSSVLVELEVARPDLVFGDGFES